MLLAKELKDRFEINFVSWFNEMLHAPLPSNLVMQKYLDYSYNDNKELMLSDEGAKKVIKFMNGTMCNQVEDYYHSR